ncbi:MAG: CoA-transferase, partial [Syntrophomonadaceae bacterium]|nr:CoA-transferase [Syntrophomonadaceae bacterium]
MEDTRSKRYSLEEAASIVKNGDVVGIGGSTFYRRPMAVIRELVRRRVRNLTLVVLTVGLETDLLVGAGCVEHIRSSYFGSESLGLAPQVRSRAENGDILITQETEITLAKGLRAARD